MVDSNVLHTTPFGRPANVNNSTSGGQGTFLTSRRAREPCLSSLLAVTDICIILKNKGESPPHTFCQITKTLNRAFPGSDVFICYKKTLVGAKNIAYRPGILDRFPLSDHPGLPLPPNLAMFCLPVGAKIECCVPAAKNSSPRTLSTFVLTNEQGVKYFGTCVSFWESYEKPLTADQLELLGLSDSVQSANGGGSVSDSSSTNDPAELRSFQTNKCICIISKYPFFTSFKRFLLFLHRMIDAGPTAGAPCESGDVQKPNEHLIPIERYIAHLMFHVPFPSLRRPRVQLQLGHETISFENPEKSQLPISGASFIDMLKNLGSENSMFLLLLALTEHKILLHSLRPHILTSVAESITSIIFPFRWQCPYIPQCPLDLAGVLHAPLPFIVGVDSRYFELYENPPLDVTCFDLDTNTISDSDVRKTLKLSVLPKRPSKVLRNTLDDLCRRIHQEDWNVTIARHTQEIPPLEKDYQHLRQRRRLELEIQEAFLVFIATLIKGYRSFLKPIKRSYMHQQRHKGSNAMSLTSNHFYSATDTGTLFDVQGFLRSRDRSSQEFTKVLLATQIFSRFIEERSGLGDRHDPSMVFFDHIIEKLEAKDAPTHAGQAEAEDFRLLEELELEPSGRGTVMAPTPEPDPGHQQQGRTFVYKKFPSSLNHQLFLHEHETLEQFLSDSPLQNLDATSVSSADLLEMTGSDTGWRARTSIEARTAIRSARQLANQPLSWAKCCLSFIYSLWFVHLRAFVRFYPEQRTKCLRIACSILDRMERARLPWMDEYCYRSLIQLCFEHEQPLLAVKVFLAMKKEGVEPNAITYAIYQRGILDARWPSVPTLNAHQYWAKLRNTLRAISLFNKAKLAARKGGAYAPDPDYNTSIVSSNTDHRNHDVIAMTEVGEAKDSEASEVEWRGQRDTVNGLSSSTRVASNKPMNRTRSWTLGLFHVDSKDELGSEMGRSLRRSLGTSLKFDSAAGVLMVDSKTKAVGGGAAKPLDIPESQSLSQKCAPVKELESPYQESQIVKSASPMKSTRVALAEGIKDPLLSSNDTGVASDKCDNIQKSPTHPASSVDSSRFTLEPQLYTHDETDDIASKHRSSSRGSVGSLSSPASRAVATYLWSGASSMKSWLGGGAKVPKSMSTTFGTPRSDAHHSTAPLIECAAGDDLNDSRDNLSQVDSDYVGSGDVNSGDASNLSFPSLLASKVGNWKNQELMKKWGSRFRSSGSGYIQRFKGRLDASPPGSDIVSSWSSYEFLNWQNFGGLQSWSPFHSPGNTMVHPGHTSTLSEDSVSYGHDEDGVDSATFTDLDESDPAFQLFSGETGTLLSNYITSLKKCAAIPSSELEAVHAADVEVTMSCSTSCSNCTRISYEEDILAGFSPNDSDWNSQCAYCKKPFLPQLYIRIAPRKGRHGHTLAQQNGDKRGSEDLCRDGTGSLKSSCPDLSGSASSLPDLYRRPGSPLTSTPHHHGARECIFRQEPDLVETPTKGKSNPRSPGYATPARRRLIDEPDDDAKSCVQASPKFISVNFLSPPVLRKELEDVLQQEGDDVLWNEHQFPVKHGIIFWNLLYYFERICVPTHLIHLILNVTSEAAVTSEGNEPSQGLPVVSHGSCGTRIRCVYDLPHIATSLDRQSIDPSPYMYAVADAKQLAVPRSDLMQALTIEEGPGLGITDCVMPKRSVSKATVRQLLGHLSASNIFKCVQLLINERRNVEGVDGPGVPPTSIYRDLLFLAVYTFGRNLDFCAFDREFVNAIGKLPPKIQTILTNYDRSPSLRTRACRMILLPLDVC